MITYCNILKQLKEAESSTARLRKEQILSESTMQKIKEGKMITLTSLATICGLLNCQPNAVIKHIPDGEAEANNEQYYSNYISEGIDINETNITIW